MTKIIGKKILDIRYITESDDENQIYTEWNYLKLSDNIFIDIPYNSDSLYYNESASQYFEAKYLKGQRDNIEIKEHIIGKTIEDIILVYYDNEPDTFDNKVFFKLSNQLYISETTWLPWGLFPGLRIYTEKELREYFDDPLDALKSYNHDILPKIKKADH